MLLVYFKRKSTFKYKKNVVESYKIKMIFV